MNFMFIAMIKLMMVMLMIHTDDFYIKLFIYSNAALVTQSVESGHCQSLPVSACDDVTSNNLPKSAFVIDASGKTPAEVVQTHENNLLEYIDLISALPVPGSCTQILLEFICYTTYPECEDVTLKDSSHIALPRLLDYTACTRVWDACAELFEAAEKLGFEIWRCEANFPTLLLSAWNRWYLDGPIISTKGTPIFPISSQNYNVTYNGTWEIVNVRTSIPDTLNSTKACTDLVCDTNGYFQKQDCRCVFNPSCPFPVYRKDQYELGWSWVVSLGLLGLPFNLLIIIRGKKYMESLPYIPIAAALAILYNILHTFIVAGLKYDMSCGKRNDFDDFAGIDNVIFTPKNASDVNGWCHVNKSTIFILQSILNASVCAMYNVFVAVNNARHNKITAPAKDAHRRMNDQELAMSRLKNAFIFTYIFGLPFICMIASYGLGDKFDTDLDTGNDVRFAFMCRPRYESLATELVLVHAQIIISGFLLLFLCYLIALSSYLLHRKMSNNPIFKKRPSQLKLPKMKLKNLKQNKQSMNTAISLAKRTIIFGILASVFLFIYTIATAQIILTLDGFGKNLEKWRDCELNVDISNCPAGAIASGECKLDKGKDCTDLDPRQNVPDFSVMALYYISPDLIIILFGIMFGFVFMKSFIKDSIAFIKFQIQHPCTKYVPLDSEAGQLKTQNNETKTVVDYSHAKTLDSRGSIGLIPQSSTKRLTSRAGSSPMIKTESAAKLEKQISLVIHEHEEGDVTELSTSMDTIRKIPPNPRKNTNDLEAISTGNDILLIFERDAKELEELADLI